MSDADDIERQLITEFICGGNQIGRTQNRTERRERLRQAIWMSGKAMHRFHDSFDTYAEVFKRAYGERLDRRAALRELPDPEPEGDGDDDAIE